MNSPVIETISRSVPWALRQLRQYLPLLTIPPLLCAVLAIAWILVTPPTWKAHQSLLVRDDMLGDNFKPGRFSSLENQKNAQETLLHIARKPEVIGSALAVLGPEKTIRPGVAWPTEELLHEVGSSIAIFAPNGAEFGKTDVVVLSVKAGSRARAKRFADLLAGQIELNLRSVRQNQLRSMQTELELATEQLQREYDLLSQKVKQVELAVGSDLPVLRSLLDRSSSASDVQRALEQIRQERRLAENELEVARKQLELLEAIESDPDQFAVSSSEVLTMQPIFKKLREGLTDAELRLLTESGRYEPGHPTILHAREVIAQTKDQIRREARAVIQGLQLQTNTAEEKLNRLRASEQQYDQRLARLAEQRVEYEVLAREMEKGGETLGKAKTELAQVQSLAESADKISLITRIGEPQAELRPEGLSKKSMVLLAILGGLLLGGGLVGLFYRPDPDAPWLLQTTQRETEATPESNERSGSRELPATVAGMAQVGGAAWSEPTRHDLALQASPASSNLEALPITVPQVAPQAASSPRPAFTPESRGNRFESGETGRMAEQKWNYQTPLGPAACAPAEAEVPTTSAEAEPESAPAATTPRERPVPLSLPGKIDLATLKQQLAEAAKLAAGETHTPEPGKPAAPMAEGLGSRGSSNPARAQAASEPTAAESSALNPVTNPDAKSSHPPVLTERIEFLSQSIATFCDAIRIEPPSAGST